MVKSFVLLVMCDYRVSLSFSFISFFQSPFVCFVLYSCDCGVHLISVSGL